MEGCEKRLSKADTYALPDSLSDVPTHIAYWYGSLEEKERKATAQHVTIRDMLTMTTLFKYKLAPYTRYFTSESWVKSTLEIFGAVRARSVSSGIRRS